jgi:hypothetical protein
MMELLRLLHFPPTPRTDAAMAQQTHFSQFPARRVVAPPVPVLAAAALATHGRAHSVAAVGFQDAQTLPTAIWRFTRLAVFMALIAGLWCWNRNRNSDALGRELREAQLTRLWGHFLAATYRERGPLSPPFTTRVKEALHERARRGVPQALRERASIRNQCRVSRTPSAKRMERCRDRVAEGISACSMVFHGVFRPAWAFPPFHWRDAPGQSD